MSEDTQTTSPEKLKALIEALDLMHEEEDWTPTAKQWKRIKSMIESLEEYSSTTPTTVGPAPVVRPGSSQLEARAATRPAGPNPATHGGIAFPQVPVGDAPTLPDGPGQQSALNQPVAPPTGNPVSSADGTVPETPPGSPGL